MKSSLIRFIESLNLWQILAIGFILRLLAAIFSIGYGMHDDHFLTIEISQSWIDGYNENGWLPDPSKGYTEASGHSLFYPFVLYYLLQFFDLIGVHAPEMKMFCMRLVHSLYSLLVVYYGYKITKKLSGNEYSAKLVGLLLATLWFMPMLSVRNLVEMVCIPPLMMGHWLILKNDNRKGYLYLLAGFVLTLAASIRFQTSLMVAATGLVVLLQFGLIPCLWFGLGSIISISLFQGLVDYYHWGTPFAEFIGYYKYNVLNSGAYPSGEWYNYILLITGMLLIPLGFFVWVGYFKNIRKNLIIWLPSLIFLAFHCYFPNKQERFILPAVPFILICGVIGWEQFVNHSSFWIKRPKLYTGLLWFFVALNGLVLLTLTVSSTKRNRVDAMIYLRKKGDVRCYIVDNSNKNSYIQMPRFYLNKWCDYHNVIHDEPVELLRERIGDPTVAATVCHPNYIIFIDDKNIGQRILEFEKYFPKLHYETYIAPSTLDQVMHWLNPVNDNQDTYIFKIDY